MDMVVVLDPDPELDAEAGERLGRQLRDELGELDVDSIRNPIGERAPDRAKSADAATLTEIVLTMSAAGGVFPTALGILRDWLARHALRHRIKVIVDGDTLELDSASTEERQQLISDFVQRHRVG
ncbi:MAG TPA: hypothetical protein VHV74_10430 [Pseudonocardiaceae bacterium]|jgi:hypothetical protein|nr:hypothetical protein [Pseudonocardiaceae bacterium]